MPEQLIAAFGAPVLRHFTRHRSRRGKTCLGEMATSFGRQRLRLATEAEIGKLFPDGEVAAVPSLGSSLTCPFIWMNVGPGEATAHFVFHRSAPANRRASRPA